MATDLIIQIIVLIIAGIVGYFFTPKRNSAKNRVMTGKPGVDNKNKEPFGNIDKNMDKLEGTDIQVPSDAGDTERKQQLNNNPEPVYTEEGMENIEEMCKPMCSTPYADELMKAVIYSEIIAPPKALRRIKRVIR